MNYKKIHNQIIDRAQKRSRLKEDYYESHHIVPKCLGGSNDKSNLVYLTAKEHFIIHKLLVRIYPEEYKLNYALWAMSCLKNKYTNKRVLISSREYNKIKLEMSEATKQRLKINNPWLGKKHSEESKIKQSESAKIRNTSLEVESIRRKNISNTSKKPKTAEHKENIRKAKLGANNPMFGKKWKLVEGKRIYYIP